MYIYRTHVSLWQGIATLVAIALVAWAVGTHMFTTTAQAASLTTVSDTLSDSAPSSVSNHTIVFSTPSGIAGGETVTVTFPGGFDLTGVGEGDIDVLVNGTASSTAATPSAGTWGVDVSGQVVTLTASTEGVASTSEIQVLIGTNATEGGAGVNQITNPSATTSQVISIAGTMPDSADLRVAIIDNVLVTADIDTTLTFTITGTTTGAVCNGAAGTWGPSTDTTLPFGTLGAGSPKTLCQDLTVATNAVNGYAVTVEQDTDLESSTGAKIDGFQDGSYTNTPAAWVSPSNNVNDDTTWGHWGLTSTDASTTRAAQFGSNEWVAASSSPRVIMSHHAAADGVTPGIGRASIGYQVEITALQEAGDDYNTTLTYIATPTF